MTDKEIIRAEIEKRRNKHSRAKRTESALEDNYLLSFIDSMPNNSLWHDAKEPPEMYRKYFARYSDGKVNGSWERHDEGFIPWKDVVKEHHITHWCYVEDLLKL